MPLLTACIAHCAPRIVHSSIQPTSGAKFGLETVLARTMKPLHSMETVQTALTEALPARTAAVKSRVHVSTRATTQAEEFFVAHIHLAFNLLEVVCAVFADHDMAQGAACASRVSLKVCVMRANEAPRTVGQVRWRAFNTQFCIGTSINSFNSINSVTSNRVFGGWLRPLNAVIPSKHQPFKETFWGVSVAKPGRPVAMVEWPRTSTPKLWRHTIQYGYRTVCQEGHSLRIEAIRRERIDVEIVPPCSCGL